MLFSESNHKPAKETKRARDSLQERTHTLHCKKVRLLEKTGFLLVRLKKRN